MSIDWFRRRERKRESVCACVRTTARTHRSLIGIFGTNLVLLDAIIDLGQKLFRKVLAIVQAFVVLDPLCLGDASLNGWAMQIRSKHDHVEGKHVDSIYDNVRSAM
jgi:hypothetical protein